MLHWDAFSASCTYSEAGTISSNMEGCLGTTDVVQSSSLMTEVWIKIKIIAWTDALAKLLGLLAIGAVVYGWFMMTISGGQDEQIKKWKDIVKWSLLGFLAVVTTGAIIRLIIEFVFDVAS